MKRENENRNLQNENEQLQRGSNPGQQNVSNKRGGTTDMDRHDSSGAGSSSSRTSQGSGISTKKEVTGSDYDGQVSE